jgi:predicted dehydrogenase
MNMIRLGLIGCGWVSKFYGDAARNLPVRCEWARAADTSVANAEKFSSAYGGKPLASSVEEVDRRIAARDNPRGLLMVGYLSRYRCGAIRAVATIHVR